MTSNLPSDNLTYRLFKLLETNPGLSQRQLARELGISLGKTHYCLRGLIDKGWIKVGNFRRNPSKRRYAYLLTPAGLAEKARVTRRFLQRRMAEYDALRAEIEALERELAE